jgi:dTDP-D-glucose 4,6-dehydratase
MERYYKRKAQDAIDANRISSPDEINWDRRIKYDPGLRKEIDAYHQNLREKVRRKYLEMR